MGIDYYKFDKTLEELGLSKEELEERVSDGYIRAFRDGDSMKFRVDDIKGIKGRIPPGFVIAPMSEEQSTYEITFVPADDSYDELGGDDLGEEDHTEIPSLDLEEQKTIFEQFFGPDGSDDDEMVEIPMEEEDTFPFESVYSKWEVYGKLFDDNSGGMGVKCYMEEIRKESENSPIRRTIRVTVPGDDKKDFVVREVELWGEFEGAMYLTVKGTPEEPIKIGENTIEISKTVGSGEYHMFFDYLEELAHQEGEDNVLIPLVLIEKLLGGLTDENVYDANDWMRDYHMFGIGDESIFSDDGTELVDEGIFFDMLGKIDEEDESELTPPEVEAKLTDIFTKDAEPEGGPPAEAPSSGSAADKALDAADEAIGKCLKTLGEKNEPFQDIFETAEAQTGPKVSIHGYTIAEAAQELRCEDYTIGVILEMVECGMIDDVTYGEVGGKVYIKDLKALGKRVKKYLDIPEEE